MISDRDGISQSDLVKCCCFINSRDCMVHSFVLTLSSFVFITSMVLAVYLTSYASHDKVSLVMIVVSCLLYLLCFSSNLYSVYHCKPICMPLKKKENHNCDHSTNEYTEQISSTDEQPPDLMDIIRAKEQIRKIPPPSKVSVHSSKPRVISRTKVSPQREPQIAEETRKMIIKMFEDVKSNDQQVTRCPQNDLAMKQMVSTPRNHLWQHTKALTKISRENPADKKRQVAVKSLSCDRQSPVYFYTNQDIPPKSKPNMSRSPHNISRVEDSNGMFSEVASKSSPQMMQPQHTTEKKFITPLKELKTKFKLKRRSKVYVADDYDEDNAYERVQVPTKSAQGMHPLQTADNPEYYMQSENYESFKRISSSSSASEPDPVHLQGKLFIPNMSIQSLSGDSSASETDPVNTRKFFINNTSHHTLSIGSSSKSDSVHYQGNQFFTNVSNQTPSVSSASESDPVNPRKFFINNASHHTLSIGSSSKSDSVHYQGNQFFTNVSNETPSDSSASGSISSEKQRKGRNRTSKLRRQLSAPSTRKLCELDESPATVVDAIGTCYDLTPDEWMVAWKLGIQGIPPDQRARILGVKMSDN